MKFLFARARMVLRLVREGRLRDPHLINAFLRVPRHAFVTSANHWRAYHDEAFEVCAGQPITCPGFNAQMLSLLAPSKGMRILDIGTGTGYQAALLNEMGCKVTSIEIVEAIHQFAKENLGTTGHEAIHLILGSGFGGAPSRAPFDAIILGCAPTTIPQILLDQLAEGAHLVAPVGGADRVQSLVKITRRNGEFHEEVVRSAWFVPMVREDTTSY